MQISREGAWIHLQQLKAVAFTRRNFFNCLFKTTITNATAIRIHVANKWIDLLLFAVLIVQLSFRFPPLITAREERS